MIRFTHYSILVLAVAWATSFQPVLAADIVDRVRLVRGTENGEVTDMTPLDVTLNKGRPGSKTVPLNEIRAILFDDEPAELAQARVSITNGAFEKALQQLEKIDLPKIRRDFIKQDIEFYQALAAAKLAQGGEGEILDAGRKLNTFVRSYPNNFHYLEASEVMGDLLMLSGRFENAEKQYAELEKAPWPDYKMRATVAAGRSLQAQNKHPEAITKFDAALALPDDGPDAKNQKLAATLGKAVSLAETGKVDEAAGMIEKIIQDADPQQRELHARGVQCARHVLRKGQAEQRGADGLPARRCALQHRARRARRGAVAPRISMARTRPRRPLARVARTAAAEVCSQPVGERRAVERQQKQSGRTAVVGSRQ